jgi:putative tryptophan/tyrosine transport system substrate-binding protein
MKRREFIAGLGSAAALPALRPRASHAQQPALPVIGFLSSASPDLFADRLSAFREGLSETGYVEGRNVAIEYRFAQDDFDRLPELATDLVRRRVAVIAVPGSVAAAYAARAATATIPIVFQTGADPVEAGLVASLNRPGGNLTGVTTLGIEVGPKRLELLHELLPNVTVVALLVNPTTRIFESQMSGMQAAARIFGLHLQLLHASAERDFEAVFANLALLRAGGLVISGDAFLISRSEQLAALALRHAVPTIFQYRDFVVAGGLMSYGGNLMDATRAVGVYTGRILKGEKPADLPVQQGTKVVLTINLKTAKALALTFPITLLGRADEVIE